MENKIKKIGFICEDLGPNQLSFQLITSANKLLEETDYYDVCLFYRNFLPPVRHANFGTFTVYEAFSYDGVTVATDLHSANAMSKWPGPNRHNMYFYVQNLEWVRLRDQVPYEQMAQVYMNPKLNLIARSEDLKNIIESVWRPVVGIVEDANVKEFVKVVQW